VNIGSWSTWHLLAIWISWVLVVVLGIFAMLAIRLWQARTPRVAGERFSSDLALAITPVLRAGLVVVVILPPLLVTGFWLWAR
jgi:hypothetical protein